MSEPDAVEQRSEPQDSEQAGAGESAAPALPEEQIEALQREVEQLRDKNLRLIAEAQNQQKRAARERQEAIRYAEAAFARALLVILDDLERTQESAAAASDVKAVSDGVRIVYEHFLKVFAQHGIEPIQADGQPFDPAVHEAILQQPSDEHPAGTVVNEIARGYRMHERVLRPSRVVVSSGPAPVEDEEQKE